MDRIAIVGGVVAGTTAAARARRCCPDGEITVFEQGEHIAYAGCGLPYFLCGMTPSDPASLVARTPEEFLSKNGVRVLTGRRVQSIDHPNRVLTVRDLGENREYEEEYTRLLLATGAHPFVPPIDGRDLRGVFVLRTLGDALAIRRFREAENPTRAVIVGAGPVGLEMCESLRRLGMEVTLVEMSEQVIPLVDPDIAEPVRVQLEREGVELMLDTAVEGLSGDGGGLRRAVTSGGELECDLCLLGIGVRPTTELAESADIELGAGGAVRVDPHFATSVPGVYAAGDCATTTNRVTGREAWIPMGSTARKQGRSAADNMFGFESEFPGVNGTSIVKCFDTAVGRTGLDEKEASEAGFDPLSVDFTALSLPEYYPGGGEMVIKVTADRVSDRVLGAQVAGDLASGADKRLDVLASAVAAGLTSDDLANLDLSYAPPFSQAVDIPLVAGNLLTGKIEGRPCSCDFEGLE